MRLSALGSHGAYVANVSELDIFTEVQVPWQARILECPHEDVVGWVTKCAVDMTKFDERALGCGGRGPGCRVVGYGGSW